MDGVHIVDESLHGLVHTVHSLVYGMLLKALFPVESREIALEVVLQFAVIQIR